VRLDPSPAPSPPSSPLPVLKSRAWRWLACLWLACACGFATTAAAAPPAAESARPQVLVLLSYHPGFSWEERILDGLREWGGAGERPVFHVEWMDAKRHPDAAQRQRLTDYLGGKYAVQRFDLVATVDDDALAFVMQHAALFGDTPVVFSGLNAAPEPLIGTRTNVTGILERFDLTRTLDIALKLHPHTRRLLFITPDDDNGAALRDTVDAALARLPGHPGAEHWRTAWLEQVAPRLPRLPGDTLVFALGSLPVRAGELPLEPEFVPAWLRARTELPVYSDLDTAVGHGAVGGYMNSGLETGRLQAALARRLLAGEAAAGIPLVRETPLALLFDNAELRRLGVDMRALPAGSTLVNAPPSIFAREYRAQLLAIVVVVLMLLLVVVGLVVRNRMQAARQRALHHQATHDELTGLRNRNGLAERLQALPQAAAEDERVALVMLGLNRFKLVNDTYGHAFGDKVLVAVAGRLRQCCGERETLVRFSGDAFVIMARLPDAAGLQRLHALCDALFQQPFLINGRRIPITAAFGLSSSPLHGLVPGSLLREADAAMYEAKRNRGAGLVVFDRGIHERAARQFRIEAGLPEAIEHGQIEVHYQPIHDIQRGCVAGYEALARWRHPELGWIPPPEFVRAAVETGHVGALTRCILRSACRAFLPHLGNPCSPYLAVNVSVSDIYASDFPAQLAQVLAEVGMPPQRLVLEVTEDMLLGDQQHVAAVLEQLRGQGVRIAIDDFGTGYSSMGYLSSYQVNLIKIDQSFVRRLLDSPSDRKIVRAIVSMAGDLELDVVVEGVETEAQIELLQELGCRLLQGYVFSRPRPAAEWAADALAGC